MPKTATLAKVPALPEFAGDLRYVARQPILDLRGRVHGYELLFRSGPEAVFRGEGNMATRTMLDNTVVYGLERLTGGLPAFVNCTAESLTEQLVHVLPSSMTVLEILESIEPTAELVGACRKFKSLGFRIALDDFIWRPGIEPLVALADYIKVDVMQTSAAARQKLLRRLKGKGKALLAEKVETQETYKEVCEEGFKLFQGYYFCRPILVMNRKMPANRLYQIEILQLLKEEDINLQELTRLMKRDASLTYRVLRLANSPLYGVRQEVRSIQSALMVVGEDTFRRLAMVAITSELGADQPAEVLRMAFTRGRFCELAAAECGLIPGEQYLLGMLSLLPAMLQLPMEELTLDLPLRAEIREALNGAASRERSLLAWIEFHENAGWAACDALIKSMELNPETMLAWYAEAVQWAEMAIRSVV